jgi:hypothetical protein
MARKVAQIVARGDRRWLIRFYLGRDHETNRRKYHNRTIQGPIREEQAYLKRRVREPDWGRDLDGAKITLNEYLDRWLAANALTVERLRIAAISPPRFRSKRQLPGADEQTNCRYKLSSNLWTSRH